MISARTIALPSCHECGLLSTGRCPACHHQLCRDHFSRTKHEPCAARSIRHMDDYACYVCGEQVEPRQWPIDGIDHVVDYSRCWGCQRFVCDHHSAAKDESLRTLRDGQRAHRYRLVSRSCATCAGLRPVGGLLGLSRRVVGVVGGAVTVLLVFLEFTRR